MDISLMFEIFTLVDITETKAKRGEDPFLVSQQQNYLTMLNTIGLRSNPTVITAPTIIENTQTFGTAYKEAKHAWRFVFDIEYGAHSVDLLEKDFTLVPFIDKLKEDCNFDIAVFDTQNKETKNIVFNRIDKY
jgi:hypothetical protein